MARHVFNDCQCLTALNKSQFIEKVCADQSFEKVSRQSCPHCLAFSPELLSHRQGFRWKSITSLSSSELWHWGPTYQFFLIKATIFFSTIRFTLGTMLPSLVLLKKQHSFAESFFSCRWRYCVVERLTEVFRTLCLIFIGSFRSSPPLKG